MVNANQAMAMSSVVPPRWEEKMGKPQLLTRLPNNRLETDLRTLSQSSRALAAQPLR